MKQFGDTLFFLSKTLKAYTETAMQTKGVGIGQLQIMMTLHSSESIGMTQKELSNHLKVDKGNISRNVRKLMEKSFVKIYRCDSGSQNIKLSNEGSAALLELIPVLVHINSQLTQNIDSETIAICSNTMELMIKNLEA